MADPRAFLLSRKPVEVPFSWLVQQGKEIPEPEGAIEVAPGVRVALLGCGDLYMPDGTTRAGALVVAWQDEAVTDWGVRSDREDGTSRVTRWDSEADARVAAGTFTPGMGRIRAAVVSRQGVVTPWREAPGPEGETARAQLKEDGDGQ